MPERIRFIYGRDWQMPANTVKVSRPSVYGNPYVAGADGTAAICVEKFRALVTGKNPHNLKLTPVRERFRKRRCMFAHGDLEWNKRALKVLRGKNLACSCPLDQPCHADVLLELANPGVRKQEGRDER